MFDDHIKLCMPVSTECSFTRDFKIEKKNPGKV